MYRLCVIPRHHWTYVSVTRHINYEEGNVSQALPIESGEPITVNFTRIAGRRVGQHVEHQGEVDVVEDSDSLSYSYQDATYRFELDTGYIRQDDDVIGRDARAKTE